MSKDRTEITPTQESEVGLSRRAVMRRGMTGVVILGTGMLGACATTTDANAKVSKAEAAYQNRPNDGRRCGGCVFYEFPVGCQRVEGLVSFHGWCALYVAEQQ